MQSFPVFDSSINTVLTVEFNHEIAILKMAILDKVDNIEFWTSTTKSYTANYELNFAFFSGFSAIVFNNRLILKFIYFNTSHKTWYSYKISLDKKNSECHNHNLFSIFKSSLRTCTSTPRGKQQKLKAHVRDTKLQRNPLWFLSSFETS